MNLWQMDIGREGWVNPRALYIYAHTGGLLVDGSYVAHERVQGAATLHIIRQSQSIAVFGQTLKQEIETRRMLSQLILPVDVW